MEKISVLFICTHNSARSQMAEGYLRARYSSKYDAYSAGTQITQVHPLAIEVMLEIGIDLSGHYSKSLTELYDKEIDIVVTVCDGESGVCPMFPGVKKTIHQEFIDPSSVSGTKEQIKDVFRNVRDELIGWIDLNVKKGGLLDLLSKE